MKRKLTPKQFWELSAQWGSYIRSGDPGACMYGFNENGRVQNEQHRQDCLNYLANQRNKETELKFRDMKSRIRELDQLREYLLTAEVSK
jgi:hypothetical protein